jgi:hypothetical protein
LALPSLPSLPFPHAALLPPPPRPGLSAVNAALQDIAAAVAQSSSAGGSGAAGAGPDGWGEQELDHTHVWVARALAVLRILLIECRCQLHLMQSNFSAARADVAANTALQERFPVLLEGMRPALHMQVTNRGPLALAAVPVTVGACVQARGRAFERSTVFFAHARVCVCACASIWSHGCAPCDG